MMGALQIIESLKLVALVCVFHHSKAIKIKWKDKH